MPRDRFTFDTVGHFVQCGEIALHAFDERGFNQRIRPRGILGKVKLLANGDSIGSCIEVRIPVKSIRVPG
jgi:hypothetical protein